MILDCKKRSLSKSWLVWSVAAVFYLYEMILRVSPSVMTEDLMISFGATSTMLGVLISFYYYAYTMLQLPCGFILDKLGPRNLLGLSAALCVIGSIFFASTNYIYIAQMGRFLIGAGSACAFISCLQITSQLFPKKYFPILAGTTNMMGTLGGLFGGMPIAKAVNNWGWQNTTYLLSVLGFVIIALVYIFIPKNMRSTKNEEKQNGVPIIQSIKKIVCNSQIMLSGVVAGFMYLPISAFSELWAIPFFMSKYGVNNEIASISSAVLFIGLAVGSVVLAFVSRKLNSYMCTIKISSLMVAFLFIPLIFCDINIYLAFITVFFIGMFTGAQVINFTCAKNNSDLSISGTTLAFVNGIVMLIGSIFQPILGLFLDLFWTGKISEVGTRMYDVSCYQKAILTLPICLIVAYILSLFIKETISFENA